MAQTGNMDLATKSMESTVVGSIYIMAIGGCYKLEHFHPQRSWLPRSGLSEGGCVLTK